MLWQETSTFSSWTRGKEARPPLLTCPGRGVGPLHGVGPGHSAQPQPVLGAGVEVLEGVAGETSLGRQGLGHRLREEVAEHEVQPGGTPSVCPGGQEAGAGARAEPQLGGDGGCWGESSEIRQCTGGLGAPTTLLTPPPRSSTTTAALRVWQGSAEGCLSRVPSQVDCGAPELPLDILSLQQPG